ncbi:MAG: hypothetical protein SF002_00920, partial [Alphaproteobacteria bacterium]|nr:hypothetical protein [Alphaproteobacteria bacterium]
LPDGDVIAGLHLPAKAAATVWRAPHQWSAKLAATSLIARHLTPPDTITLLPPHSATGSITSPTEGDGWHAIGDAAMAYDPLSGFGIHAALQDAVWLTDGTPSVERARRRAAIRLAYLRSLRPSLMEYAATRRRHKNGD